LYLDTSTLVTVIVRETGSESIEAALERRKTSAFAISDWVVAEFSSALSIKVRAGTITPELQSEALQELALLSAENLDVLPVSRAHFRAAALFSNKAALGLRASDALHIAICADHGATLCSLDTSMNKAAVALGIPAVEP
jgi:predicted nucleic acid-binding protein